MNSSLLISLVLFLATWFVTAAPNNGICYNTDQIQDGGYLPCDPEAEVSFCCKPGDICLSKGLCEPSVNTSSYDTPYFTSLCTDYSWNSPSTCLEICNNNPSRQVISYDVVLLKRVIQYKGNANIQCSLNPSNGTGVQPCGNDNYCCYGFTDARCCATPSLLFSLDSDPATIQRTLGSALTSTAPVMRVLLSTSSPGPPSPTSSRAPSPTPSSTPSSKPSTPSELSPPSAETVVTPSPSAHPGSDHVAVGVGVGVGIPVGLAILAGLTYLIRRRSNGSNDGYGVTAYLDDKKELHANRKIFHQPSEIGGGGGTLELSGQSLAELQHSDQSRAELQHSDQSRAELQHSGQSRAELQH